MLSRSVWFRSLTVSHSKASKLSEKRHADRSQHDQDTIVKGRNALIRDAVERGETPTAIMLLRKAKPDEINEADSVRVAVLVINCSDEADIFCYGV
jgi:hypothetical protein